MNFLNPDVLCKELDAALIYFDTCGGDPEENGIILEQITAAILMVESSKDLDDEEVKLKQLETVRSVVQNLHLFKIADTGTDLLNMAVEGVVLA